MTTTKRVSFLPSNIKKQHFRALLFLFTILLTACSRYENDADRAPYELNAVGKCLDGSPYETFKVLENISLGDGLNLNFDHLTKNYTLNVNNLTETLVLTPEKITTIFTPDVKEEFKIEDDDLDTITLSNDQVETFENAILELTGQNLSLEFSNEFSESQPFSFNEDNTSFSVLLSEGLNDIKLNIESNITIPVVGAECRGTESSEGVRSITLNEQYIININRGSFDNLITQTSSTEIELPSSLSSFNASLKSFSANSDWLVVGLPNDSSDLTGVTSSLDALNTSLLTANLLTDSGAVIVYRRNAISERWDFHAYIKHEHPDTGDKFGNTVAVDGNRILVGSIGDDSSSIGIINSETDKTSLDQALVDNNNLNSGAVFVYEIQNLQISMAELIKSPTIDRTFESQESFAHLIKVHDNQLFLADPYFDNKGTVHIYSKTSSGYASLQTLTTTRVEAGDQFGFSLDADSNVMVVGSPGNDSNYRGVVNDLANFQPSATVIESDYFNDLAENSGAAYIYLRNSSGNWEQYSYLKAINTDPDDLFGFSVTVQNCAAPINNDDSYSCSIAVGAPNEDGEGSLLNREVFSNNLLNSGAVYEISSSSIDFDFGSSGYFKSDLPAINNFFGSSIVGVGSSLFIGEPNRLNSIGNRGVFNAFKYSFSNNQWSFLEFFESGNIGDTAVGEMIDSFDSQLFVKHSDSKLLIYK